MKKSLNAAAETGGKGPHSAGQLLFLFCATAFRAAFLTWLTKGPHSAGQLLFLFCATAFRAALLTWLTCHFHAPLRPRIAGKTWLLGAGTHCATLCIRALSPALRLRCRIGSRMRIAVRMEDQGKRSPFAQRARLDSQQERRTNNTKTHANRCQFTVEICPT
jgi:hypothetical protein